MAPCGPFGGLPRTGGFPPLEPDAVEEKLYAPGTGTALEIDPGGVSNELVGIHAG